MTAEIDKEDDLACWSEAEWLEKAKGSKCEVEVVFVEFFLPGPYYIQPTM